MKTLSAWCLRVVAAIACGMIGIGTATAQALPDPLTVPNLPLLVAGTVNALARQPDGGIVIGGSFSFVNGQARTNLARLKPDGTLDDAWTPTLSSSVSTIAVNAATGAVYIGGFFTTIDGVTRNRIAKFDASGQLDANWDPSASSTVTALIVDAATDTVYVGGAFTTIGVPAATHTGLAKIAGGGIGTVDASWTPAVSAFATTSAMALTPSGALYLGGSFTTITGSGDTTATARKYLAKLDATSGALDANWNPSASQSVTSLAVDPASGAVYAGGNFITIGVPAVSRVRLAKIDGGGIGAIDATWTPAASSTVYALALDAASGKITLGGAFTTITGSADTTATTRNRLARLDSSSGALDPGWDPNAGNTVSALVASGDAGTVYAGGTFGTVGSATQLSFAALASSDGTLASSADVANKGSVAAIAHQSNGGLIVGGNFLKAGTAARTHLLRLDADGNLDANFRPVPSSNVSALTVGAGDVVYASGFFTTINSITVPQLAKLDGATGAVITSWAPCSLSAPASTMVESAGSLYLGGSFTTVCGINQNRLAKLDATTGARDASWVPSPSSGVNVLAADASGAIYAGGNFGTIGGGSHPYIAKLDGVTGAAASWNPAINSSVSALVLDGNGSLYLGGAFITATVGGTTGVTRNRLLKLDTTTGEVEANWNPNSSANVNALLLDGNGSLYVGTNSATGTIGGQTRPYLSKVDAGSAGAVNANWIPTPNATINALALGANGAIFAGGGFSLIGTTTRLALAALPAGPLSTTSIVSVSPATSVVGETYTVSVDVAAASGTPTGSVTISDDLGASCTASLASGSASCAIASVAAGERTLTARFTSTDFATSSATATHTVSAAQTTLAIGADTPATSVYGQEITVTFALAVQAPGAGAPGGNVTVSVDGDSACSAMADAGQCTIAAAQLATGEHAIEVAYAGDANYGASAASTTLTVTPAAVGIALGDLAQTYDGTPHAVSVTTDPAGIAVTLSYAGGASAPIDAGSYEVVATTADPNYAGTATATLVIAAAASSTTITAVTPDSPTPGQPVTVSYAVTSVDALSGNVTVVADSGESCSGSAAAGQCVLSFAGTGSRSLTASYAGDANHAASSSASVPLTVVAASLTITLGNLEQVYDGTSRVVIATTTPANIAITLSYDGSVTPPIAAGNYTVVAASADPNYAGTATATLVVAKAASTTAIGGASPANASPGEPVTVTYSVTGIGDVTGDVTVFADSGESCTATVAAGQCLLSFDAAGPHVLAASYAGDANHMDSLSANYVYADVIFADGFD